jgi:hypothetical protein
MGLDWHDLRRMPLKPSRIKASTPADRHGLANASNFAFMEDSNWCQPVRQTDITATY